jgi:hypothetical protein
MTRQSLNCEDMIRALEAYRKEHGDCRVQANYKKNPQLGRWVAMQRYRRKIGELSAEHVGRLDKLGFVWSPTDIAWDKMLANLVQFKKRQGHCNVPSVWPADPKLASWVANQRHRKKTGTLAPDRAKRLDDLGFSWALYGIKKEEEPFFERVAVEPVVVLPPVIEERLYHILGEYVQYNGVGPCPGKLEKYIQQHDGEFPPYIPLPHGALTFILQSETSAKGRRLKWAGQGPIPELVREYVNENGVLPQHS